MISAWVDFGHIPGNTIQETDRISFLSDHDQIKTMCVQIDNTRF